MTKKKVKPKIGKIFYSKKAIVQPHELRVAEILIKSGDNVHFLIPSPLCKTPDIYYQGKNWEIKSPQGCSTSTLERNLKNALSQSGHIIIDLGRTSLPDNKCLTQLRNLLTRARRIKSLIVVKKDSEPIKLK